MIDTIDLSPEHKTRLLNVIAEHIPGVDVLVYGSRINGRSHEGSDLDIALRTRGSDASSAVRLEQLEQLKQAIQSINLPFVVDVRTWTSLPIAFQTEILKRCVLLTEKSDSSK